MTTMFSIFNKISNIFTDNQIQQVQNVPKLEDFIKVHSKTEETKSFTGSIISWNNNQGVISTKYDDNRHAHEGINQEIIGQHIYFDESIFEDIGHLRVGVEVRGVASRSSENDFWRATRLHINADNWIDNNVEDPAENIPVRPDGRNIVIDKVMCTQQNIAYLEKSGAFHMSDSTCSFQAMPGDWVRCSIETQTDDNTDVQSTEILSVVPLRKKTISGIVTSARHQYFIFNNEIYCPWNLVALLGLSIGDSAILEVIESHQEKWFWRVIKLTFQQTTKTRLSAPTENNNVVVSKETRQSIQNLQNSSSIASNINNLSDHSSNTSGGKRIIISSDIKLKEVVFMDVFIINVFIENISIKTYTLQKVFMTSFNSKTPIQLLEFKSDSLGSVWDSYVTLNPKEKIKINLKCAAKNIGHCKPNFVFKFDSFSAEHVIEFYVKHSEHETVPSTSTNKTFSPNLLPRCRPVESNLVIQGVRPFQITKFLPKRLPRAEIPTLLWESVEDWDLLVSNYPILEEPLQFHNYTEKLSLLLHLEELELSMQLNQYTLERACFTPHGEYLALVVPGLLESRPSIMLGDSVRASIPRICTDSNKDFIEYEGFVHQVLQNKVLLQFHPSFHQTYAGEDYRVRFCFNRNPIRRNHFAVDFVKQQLGENVLFPKSIASKLPQATYIDSDIFCYQRGLKDFVTKQLAEIKQINIDNNLIVKTKKNIATQNIIKTELNVQTNIDLEKKSEIKNYITSLSDISKDEVNNTCKTNLPILPFSFVQEVVNSNEYKSLSKKCDLKMDTIGDIKILSEKDELNLHSIKVENSSLCSGVDCDFRRTKTHNRFSDDVIDVVLRDKCNVDLNFEPKDNIKTMHEDSFKISKLGSSYEGSVINQKHNKLAGDLAQNKISNYRGDNKKYCYEDSNSNSINVVHNNCEKGSPVKDIKHVNKSNNNVIQLECVKNINYTVNKIISVDDVCNFKTKEIINKNLNVDINNFREKPVSHYTEDTYNNLKSSTDINQSNVDIINQTDIKEKQLFIPRSVEKNLNNNSQVKPKYKKMELNVNKCYNDETDKLKDVNSNISLVDEENFKVNKELKVISNAENIERKINLCLEEKQKNPKEINILSAVKSTDKCPRKVKLPRGYIVPKLKRKVPKDIKTFKWFNTSLNYEQKQAVKRIIEGTIRPTPYIIFGPPGTGKTMCVVESVLQVLRLVDHCRILISTPTNSASDLIVERLDQSGAIVEGDMARINAYQRSEDSIPESILKHCFRTSDIEDVIYRKVIVATATTIGVVHNQGLKNGHFSHVFIDEAGQMTEPESCCVLSLVNKESGQIVLAGDPEQLGPVIFSKLAKQYGLEISLLERLVKSVLYQPDRNNMLDWQYEPRLVTQLVKNYRSHPDIIKVSSELFYDGRLYGITSLTFTERLLNWSELPNPKSPLLFHGMVSDCTQEGDSPSWFNPGEAFQAVRYAKSLLNYGLNPDDIGIITPYRKQVHKIHQLFETFKIDSSIKVGSVEEFQGQEKLAIIISTVRSNLLEASKDAKHRLGFVSSPKRFNVAITRAQALLVVVGNPFLLNVDQNWKHFINYCMKRNAYMGPDLS